MTLDLEGTLHGAGIDVVRTTSKEIWAHCPKHQERTGKADITPSWSINTTAPHAHFCFSCGYRGVLRSLLVDLTGTAPDDLELELGRQSLVRSFRQLAADPGERRQAIKEFLSEWELLHRLFDVPDRLLNHRWLRRPAVDAYTVRFDPERASWVLPLWDRLGALVGAQYKGGGMAVTYPVGLEKSKLLFGLRTVRRADYVVLVESPLDAVRLFGLGIPAVASLGAYTSQAQCRMLARDFGTIYLALDNDQAGWDGMDRAHSMLGRYGAAPIIWNYGSSDAKDIGDVPDDDEIRQMWAATRRLGF